MSPEISRQRFNDDRPPTFELQIFPFKAQRARSLREQFIVSPKTRFKRESLSIGF